MSWSTESTPLPPLPVTFLTKSAAIDSDALRELIARHVRADVDQLYWRPGGGTAQPRADAAEIVVIAVGSADATAFYALGIARGRGSTVIQVVEEGVHPAQTIADLTLISYPRGADGSTDGDVPVAPDPTDDEVDIFDLIV